ncbi:helix-turn-helix domain-containing protein [Streptomyces shenzhenensis]|uniref:helix-turn-helix domain-containing protein n=1 Tax=Streptomyces shenzhenensis TaxID=943815 RepID=UPI00215DBD13|nr:LysR family transcriptional regulator [Streptomyces shenzhenensis]
MTLELSWLRTWIEVVDSGGFTRAAEKMPLSQPCVSAHIANLERELGCVLIERHIRPLTLTDYAEALARALTQAFTPPTGPRVRRRWFGDQLWGPVVGARICIAASTVVKTREESGRASKSAPNH